MKFQERVDALITKNKSLLCVGLDSDFDKIPAHLKNKNNPLFDFNKSIIDKTYDLVCCYKINSAFYEAQGAKGTGELKKTCDYIKKNYPELSVILDAKRADIGNTNEGYVKFAYDYLKADAITLHPYLGKEAIKPFLERKEKGAIILCRTSNIGAGELQDLKINNDCLYIYVAKRVVGDWNYNGNCLLVVGATYPRELAEIRKLVGDMTILVPGIGVQGGDVQKTVRAGLNSQNAGIIIHAARSIIFASAGRDFAQKTREAAQKLRDEINRYRKAK